MPLAPSPSSRSESTRQAIAAALQPVVLDLLALRAVAHKAHVNVRGEQFGQLHKAFQAVYEMALEQADRIAEQIAMLGVLVEMDHMDVAERAAPGRLAATADEGELVLGVLEAVRACIATVNGTGDGMNGAKAACRRLADDDSLQKLIDVSIALHDDGWKRLAAFLPEEEPASIPGDAAARGR